MCVSDDLLILFLTLFTARNACKCKSALFNFSSLLLVILLLICSCSYVKAQAPTLLDKNKHGMLGLFWKAARIGERLSPYVSFCCIVMAISKLLA